MAGGFGEDGGAVDAVHVLRDGAWEPLRPLSRPRGAGAAAVVDGLLVVVGGEGPGGNNREVERYDPASDGWVTLPPMRTPRHGIGTVALGQRLLVVTGGLTPGLDPSAVAEELDLGT